MKVFIYISLLSQVTNVCLGSDSTKEEDLGEVWKMFEEGDTFSEYSKMLEPIQKLPKNDVSEEYNILDVPDLDPNYDTVTFGVAAHNVATYDPRTTKEREPYYESEAKFTKAEQQALLSPPPTTLNSSQPMPFYGARNIPPPTLLAGQRTVSLPPSKPWLRNQKRPFKKTKHNERFLKPVKELGIINLVAGPHACLGQFKDQLICYFGDFGIRVVEYSFQILPSLKRLEKKQKSDKSPAEKDKTKKQKSESSRKANDKPRSRILNSGKPDADVDIKKSMHGTVNRLSSKQIEDNLKKKEHEGGIIGKFEKNQITIYSVGLSLYEAFLHSENSITLLKPRISVPVKTGDILFLVPNGTTGQMIKDCLLEGPHPKVLECMASTFHGAYRLWGDFVIATIGQK